MRLTVAVRCRPASSPPAELVRLHMQQHVVETPRRAFQFDGLFAGNLDGERLYEQAALPLVEAVLAGRSAAIIATGAERSGKSFALFGMADGELGVVVRALCDLVAAARAHGDSLALRAALVLDGASGAGGEGGARSGPAAAARYDLLAPNGPAPVVDPARARMLPLCCAADVHEAVRRAVGARARCVLGSAELSRAHTVVTAEYCSPSASAELLAVELGAPAPAHAHGALCAVLRALAGSASAAGGGSGGNGRASGGPVGWRESTLTRALKPHLERAAACTVLLCVDPSDRALPATVATLGWGRRLQRFVATASCDALSGAGARAVLAAAAPVAHREWVCARPAYEPPRWPPAREDATDALPARKSTVRVHSRVGDKRDAAPVETAGSEASRVRPEADIASAANAEPMMRPAATGVGGGAESLRARLERAAERASREPTCSSRPSSSAGDDVRSLDGVSAADDGTRADQRGVRSARRLDAPALAAEVVALEETVALLMQRARQQEEQQRAIARRAEQRLAERAADVLAIAHELRAPLSVGPDALGAAHAVSTRAAVAGALGGGDAPDSAFEMLAALEAELRAQLRSRRADVREARAVRAQLEAAADEVALGRGRENLLLNAIAAFESERTAMGERLVLLERLLASSLPASRGELAERTRCGVAA